jgi:hemolysin D
MPPSSAAENVIPLPIALPAAPKRKKPGRNYELEFLPAAIEILESPASPLGRAVALAISLFVAIAILWACVGEIDIVAVAQGRIVPTGRTKIIQAPGSSSAETGLVKRIAVEDGQHVTQGQLLVELDSTETGADRDKIAQQLMQTKLDIARLRSILGLPGGELLDHPQTGTTAFDPVALLLAQSLKQTQLAGEAEKLASFDREADRQQAEARADQNEIDKFNQTLPLAIQRQMYKQDLLVKGLTPKTEMLTIQQQLIEMQRDRDGAVAHLSETKSQVASTQRQKAQADEEFKRDRLKELSDAETQAQALDQELAKADEHENAKRITAPVSGTVQQLSLHTVGGILQPGQQLMQIVPDDTGIEIEAMVQNQDIGFVHEGEDAVVKLEAFPFTRYGTVPGKIETIAEDAVSNPNTSSKGQGTDSANASSDGQGQLLYTARVVLDRTTIDVDGKQVKLTPGMAATVEIKTGKRKMIEFLLSPLMRMGSEAGRER